MFFNKHFYEILSNIKVYQSETVSQHSPCQNSPSCCTLACLFAKGSLLILTSSCYVCLHLHKMLWFYWLDGLEGPLNPPNRLKRKQFHGFGWFWVLTEGWKETVPWKRKSRISLKSISKPCIFLKSENVNIGNEGTTGKKKLNFWKLAFEN